MQRSEKKLDKVISILENRFGPHELNDNNESTIDELIPDFLTLRSRMHNTSFFNFAHTFLTTECQLSYDSFRNDKTITDMTFREAVRTQFVKQKRAMKLFEQFLTDVPTKPNNAQHLYQWKNEMSVCINNGIKRFQKFTEDHKLKKGTRKTEITVHLLTETKTVELVKSHFSKETGDVHNPNCIDVETV